MTLYANLVVFCIQYIPLVISLVAFVFSSIEYVTSYFEPNYAQRNYDFIIGKEGDPGIVPSAKSGSPNRIVLRR